MYILRIAETGELVAKQTAPFEQDYIKAVAQEIGRVLEIISPEENDY